MVVTSPYFQAAEWLWTPIRSNPVLDPQSTNLVDLLKQGAHACALHQFGVTLRGPAGIMGSTPRYMLKFENVPGWGPSPFGSETMPIPLGTLIPPGSDHQISIADPTTNFTYSIGDASYDPATDAWTAGWGALATLNGDGRDTIAGGASTGSRLNRFAAVIRVAEIAAGVIQHALFFGTDMAAPSDNFRYPSPRSDGSNLAGVATPIPEGARVQLDPHVNVASIPGISPIEVMVGRALQTYGAYCGDNGGARMGFVFEFEGGTDPGPTYVEAGATYDYFSLSHLPWNKLRVLSRWDGR